MPLRTKRTPPHRPAVRYLVLRRKPTFRVAGAAALAAAGVLTWVGVSATAGEPKASSHSAVRLSGPLVPPPVPTTGAYLGIDPGACTGDTGGGSGQSCGKAGLSATEAEIRRPVGVDSLYTGFPGAPPISTMDGVSAQGSIPMVSWGCQAPDAAVADGQYDGLIGADAEAYKAFGKPTLLRWFWEMNIPRVPECDGIDVPAGIALGPDGDLWLTNQGGNPPTIPDLGSIERMTPAGVVTDYTGTAAERIDKPTGITAGPDGNLWFTNEGNGKTDLGSIGEITTAGVVTNYTGSGIDKPTGITHGPDNNLWFTNAGNNSIGRITTAGVVTNYTGTGISKPTGITAGSDGNLWFTNEGNNSIGRITTAGVVTHYAPAGSGINAPTGITLGPDGNLWFTNQGNNSIGRITTAGVVKNYASTKAQPISKPTGITAGSDGNLWFTNEGNNSIGRVTTAGVVTHYTPPGSGINGPTAIAPGPDGNLWFTNQGNDSIGVITTAGVVTPHLGLTSLPIDEPAGIASGPDQNLWFTNRGNGTTADPPSIGQITTAGVVANFTGTGISEPTGITEDVTTSSLWFTNEGSNSIGQITTAGVVTNYTGTGISEPTGIAVAPDGNLWFTNEGNDSIGQITTAGVVTNYAGTGISKPTGIALGPDGNLWFTNEGNDSIGQITPAGTVANFTGTGIDEPTGITKDAATGSLWFTNLGNNSIGQITTAGVVTNYTGTGISDPSGITALPDGNLWFTNQGNGTTADPGSIGQITTAGVVADFTGSASAPISGPTAITVGPDGNLWYANQGNVPTDQANDSIGWMTTAGAPNYSGSEPAQYIAAYQRIWTVFQQVGATNVAFVWSPSAGHSVASGLPFYPGSSYVDWIGTDLYDRQNGDGCVAGPPTYCREFQKIYPPAYADYSPLGKPIMITETGDDPGPCPVPVNQCEVGAIPQAQWLQEIQSSLQTTFTDVHGLVYVNASDALGNYTLAGAGLAQFEEMARSNFFARLG